MNKKKRNKHQFLIVNVGKWYLLRNLLKTNTNENLSKKSIIPEDSSTNEQTKNPKYKLISFWVLQSKRTESYRYKKMVLFYFMHI